MDKDTRDFETRLWKAIDDDRTVMLGLDGAEGGESDKLDHAREGARHAARSLRERAHRTRAGAQEMFEDNPLAVGAIAVAAGALLGALLPETSREDALMGAARDRLAERAHVAGDQALHQARRADAQADTHVPPSTH